jgi:hypothetical protein
MIFVSTTFIIAHHQFLLLPKAVSALEICLLLFVLKSDFLNPLRDAC